MGKFREFLKRKVRRHINTGGNAVLNQQCERLEVNNWVISEFIMYELVPVVGIHPYPLNELCLMVTAVAALKPTHLFEWGTNLGKSARIFHEASTRFGIGTRIYSVDLPEDVGHVEHPHGKRGVFVKGIDGVTLLLGDGLDTSLNLYYEQKAKGKISPMFFIDGDHSYDSVKRELETIISTIPEASILLHDTFYQSRESSYNIGPYRAIEDVLTVAPQQYLRLTQNLGLPGMTLLYRKQL